MSLTLQWLTLLHMTGAGIYLGAIFDTFFQLRGPARASRWQVVEDLLFWLLNGILVFLWLQAVNQGEMRFSVLAAIGCGYFMYKFFLQTVYLRVLHFIIRVIASIYRGIIRVTQVLIIRPIVWIIKLLLAVLTFLGAALWRLVLFLIKPFVSLARTAWAARKRSKKKGFLTRVANKWFTKKK